MRCIGCTTGADGYAVIPGIGEAGEIRFYCDPCARRDRVKMRYWDARECDTGGYRDKPDLGSSFVSLVFSFEDLARMRKADLIQLLEWVDDRELASAVSWCSSKVDQIIFEALPPERAKKIRSMRGRRSDQSIVPEEAQAQIIRTLRQL